MVDGGTAGQERSQQQWGSQREGVRSQEQKAKFW
jgi:hypothetical protein